jgi:hypothetical protein
MSRRVALLSVVLLPTLSGVAQAAVAVDKLPPLQPCYRVTVTAPALGHNPYVDVCVPGR